MNLRDLEYLIAVAEHLHFGRAAEAACVSQPTLSGQVKKLEEQLGVIIFERSTRGVKVTPTGERIIAEARRIFEHTQEIENIALSQTDIMSGPLGLGLIPTIAPYLVPYFLSRTLSAYPNLSLSVHEDFTDNLLSMLENFQIDAAVLATDVPGDQFEEIFLYEEDFYLVCPKGHPLTVRKNVDIESIVPSELLLLSEGHCLRDQTLELCRLSEQPAAGQVDLRAASLQTLVELVRAGRGYTLLPKLAALPIVQRSEHLELMPLHPKPSRRVRLVFRRSFPRKASLEQLAETIRGSVGLTQALCADVGAAI